MQFSTVFDFARLILWGQISLCQVTVKLHQYHCASFLLGDEKKWRSRQ